MTNAECRRRLQNVANYTLSVYDFETICAFSGSIRQGVCRGDSGGPLVFENKLVGITSWAFGCGQGAPDGFTRVSLYVDWVKNKIKASL